VPTNTYDLIVLGDELAGLVSATLCAARGMRVLLATTRSDPEAYQLGPHKLPIRPLSFVGMSSPAVRRVMEELNFTHLLKRRLRDNNPAFQFIGPDARLDFTGDDDALALECERDLELGDANALLAISRSARGVSELLDPILGQAIAFPPHKFFDKREIARNEEAVAEAGRAVAAAVGDSILAGAILAAPAALGGHGDPTALTDVSRARAFDLWRRGVAQLPGGREALRSIFLDKFASHGGEVRNVAAEELTISWGKVTGVLLRDREQLGAEHVIAAMPLDELVELCGSKVPKRVAQVAEQFAPAAFRYTLNLVMAEAGIPEGIGSTALVVADPSAPLVGDNAIAIHIGEPDEEARITVSLEALCEPPSGKQTLEDKLADLRIRLRERLEDVMPFSSDHVLVAHSPNEAAGAEGIRAKPSLSSPFEPQPTWRTDIEPLLGVAAAPYNLGVKRLTIASPQVMPGLGLEGELEVGWCAALIACSGSKKKDYLKDEVLAHSG
jgi:hypothetical protein